VPTSPIALFNLSSSIVTSISCSSRRRTRVCLPGPVSARKPGAKGPNRTITTRVRSDYPLSNVRRSQRARRSELLSSNRPMETRLDRAHRPVARCNPERLAVPSRAEALCGSAGASRHKRPPDRAHFATLAGGSASPTTRSPNRWFMRQRGVKSGSTDSGVTPKDQRSSSRPRRVTRMPRTRRNRRR
jgi:hypothetical protein